MHIEVDHAGTLDQRPVTERCDGNRDVVKNAKTRAFRPKRVVCTARKSSSKTVWSASSAGRNRAADGCESALHQIDRPWKTDAPDDGRINVAAEKASYVLCIVHQRDCFKISLRCFAEFEQSIGNKGFPQQPILSHRELMPRRQRNFVVVAVVQPVGAFIAW